MAAGGGSWKSGRFVAAKSGVDVTKLAPEETGTLSALSRKGFLHGPGPKADRSDEKRMFSAYKRLIDKGLVTGRSYGMGERYWRFRLTARGESAAEGLS